MFCLGVCSVIWFYSRLQNWNLRTRTFTAKQSNERIQNRNRSVCSEPIVRSFEPSGHISVWILFSDPVIRFVWTERSESIRTHLRSASVLFYPSLCPTLLRGTDKATFNLGLYRSKDCLSNGRRLASISLYVCVINAFSGPENVADFLCQVCFRLHQEIKSVRGTRREQWNFYSALSGAQCSINKIKQLRRHHLHGYPRVSCARGAL